MVSNRGPRTSDETDPSDPTPYGDQMRDLYRSIPQTDTATRKLVSRAHGFGHDDGYDDARSDLLAKIRRRIRSGEFATLAELDSWLTDRIQKAKDFGRWPEGRG